MQFTFNNSLPFIYIVLFFIVSIAISFFYYKNARKDSPKILLITLRTLFIFFLLLLFLSPLISYLKKEDPKVTPVILTDNSKSLLIEDRYKMVNGYSNISNDIRTFNFDGEKPDTLLENYNKNLTSLTPAFDRLIKDRPSAPGSVTIISDGMLNSGNDLLISAEKTGCPVNYVLTGDTIQKKDILITEIYNNKTSYVDSKTHVRVSIHSYGYSGNAEVTLYNENNVIEKKSIPIDVSKENYEVEFFLISSKKGFAKYRAGISAIAGEITEKNNSKDFIIEFLENKFNVLFISGGPSSDLVFIKDEVKRISNINADYYTQKNSNEFYEGSNINFDKKDIIVLIGYPTAISNSTLINTINDHLKNGKTSLVFIESRNVDYEKLKALQSFTPFNVVSPSNSEEETGLNGITGSSSENKIDVSGISGFNNVFRNRTLVNVRTNSSSYIVTKSGFPALVINNASDAGSAAFLFHGLYKWKLNPASSYRQNFFGELFLNTIKNISKKNNSKDLEILIDQNRLLNNELVLKAKINGNVLINDPKLKAYISLNNSAPEIVQMNKLNGSMFEYSEKINYGINDIRIYAEVQGLESKYSDSLRALIDTDLEFRETAATRSKLKELALNTGGFDLTGKDMKEVIKIINDQSKIVSQKEKPEEFYKRDELKFNGY